ncbi:hypothetical protein GGI04_000236 [Coemansia thaxteri]|uniref:CLIP1 zinc knuckle domain-containing protein n=1 Tax=Coemansia thaxteri TaxID=2663907 RepID=A0A9W8BNB7_9FUNG|nr:hypothetical protein H4R26_000570 [Coemansia thaxteri]KAJ2009664.1 hypothetical protein GGI04_000236 [Coemansia thaxteri]KAJ2487361.1 hypothetical protein EV174_000580 [Coemansia sp. RSA 2320]
MLEAENRVLRLKGEQDKAHLAAGHMLARGLATVNGAASPQTRGGSEGVSRFSPRGPALPPAASESSDTSGLNQQLNDARDLLERERQESKARVALLVSQIRDLKLQGGSDGSIAVASTERAEAQSQTVLADEGSGARIAQLESILEQTTQEYTQELALAKKTQTDLELELEARSSTNRDLQSDLEARSSEVASLDSRLKQADAERLRANDMLKELAQEHEQKQADDSSEKSELASNLNNQVEKLRQGLVASEEQRLGMSSRLDTTQNLLATAETKLTAAQDRLVLLEERVADYDAKSDLAGLYHSRMCLTVEAVQKLAERTCSADAGADEFLPESCSVEAATRLYARLQALVARLDSTASVQPFPKASSEGADADDRVRSEQDAGLLAQIGELEELNNTLVKERDQITHEQTLVNDYLGKLESECNRLVEDIEQLNAENQRLSENLRAASLQNSTISLDIGSLDARLVDEQAGASGSPPRAANPTTSSGVADDTAGALGQQARELAATRAQLAELKQHKDSEIKRLQDELGCLEDLIEDKIFNESELNDKISSLTSEVERLQHKLQRLQGVGEVNAAAATSAGSGPKPEPNGVVTVASSVCDKDVTARTGPSGPQRDALRTEDASDDEPAYCDICDVRSHGIADCPQLNAAPSALFKNEVSIDSSRPYCDNCEAFVDHWTDECPHGDEMF